MKSLFLLITSTFILASCGSSVSIAPKVEIPGATSVGVATENPTVLSNSGTPNTTSTPLRTPPSP